MRIKNGHTWKHEGSIYNINIRLLVKYLYVFVFKAKYNDIVWNNDVLVIAFKF